MTKMMYMIEDIVKAVKEYAANETTKKAIEENVIAPCTKYVDDKLAFGVRIFQIVALLVLVQTVITVFLLILELRRR